MPGKASRRISKQEQAERKQRFEDEVMRLMDRLYGTALRLTRNTDDAEDVVAETVSKAWSHLDDLDDLDCLPGWLFRILNNVFVGEWRKRQTRQRLWEDAKQAGDLDSPEDFSLFQKLHQPFLLWWGTPEDAFVNDLLHEDIQRALDSLPDEYRVAIVLIEVQGYTYNEAANLLDVPVGTIRSRLSRARSLLQRALWTQACAAGLRSETGDSGHENGAGT